MGRVLESKRVYTYRFRSRKNSPITASTLQLRISLRVFELIEGQCRCQADTLTLFPDFFPPSNSILSSRTRLPRFTVLISIYRTTSKGVKVNGGTLNDISIFFPFFPSLVSFIKSSTYSGAGFLQRCVPVHAIGH